jgi:hypothetical protein
MYLQEVGCGGMDWRERQALVKAVMNIQVPQNAGNFLTKCKPVSFSRMTLFRGWNLRAGN